MLRPALFVCLALACPAFAQTASFPPDVQSIIDEAAALCDGEVTIPDTVAQGPDLNGDGKADWLVDQSLMSCTTSASLYCGTQGCGVDTLIDGVRGGLILHSWAVETADGRTYLTAPNDAGQTVRFFWTGAEWELQQ